MSDENLVSYTADQARKLRQLGMGKTDWKRLAEMKDEDIDCSEIPELDEEWFKNARLVIPETKERLTVRFDRDVVSFFRRQGKGYQTRMNAILRAYMEAQLPK
jgi:uncharacterized protein (DUF4415 family)